MLSKLRIFIFFFCFFAFNFYVVASDGLSFKKPVTCEAGHEMLIDHTGVGNERFSGEDYCSQKSMSTALGPVPASCPQIDQRELRKNLIEQQSLSIEKYGRSVQNVIDRLIRSLNRKNRLTFSKVKHRGRDTCVVEIGSREIRRFIPSGWHHR